MLGTCWICSDSKWTTIQPTSVRKNVHWILQAFLPSHLKPQTFTNTWLDFRLFTNIPTLHSTAGVCMYRSNISIWASRLFYTAGVLMALRNIHKNVNFICYWQKNCEKNTNKYTDFIYLCFRDLTSTSTYLLLLQCHTQYTVFSLFQLICMIKLGTGFANYIF